MSSLLSSHLPTCVDLHFNAIEKAGAKHTLRNTTARLRPSSHDFEIRGMASELYRENRVMAVLSPNGQ
jgi:hypothetical protein